MAAQEAERAKFIVEKAEQDKKGAIIRAQVRRNAQFSSFVSRVGTLIIIRFMTFNC